MINNFLPGCNVIQTAYISHPDGLKHDMGPGHPQCPARLSAIKDQLITSSLLNYLQQHDAPLATFGQLARVHLPQYIETILATSPKYGLIYLDPDNAMNPHTLKAAL